MVKIIPAAIYIGLKYKVKIGERENSDGSYSVCVTSRSTPEVKPHKTRFFFHGDRNDIANWLSKTENVVRIADYYRSGVHISLNKGGLIYVGL